MTKVCQRHETLPVRCCSLPFAGGWVKAYDTMHIHAYRCIYMQITYIFGVVMNI